MVEEGDIAPAETGTASAFDKVARRLRILVVDDNRDAADTLALLLETAGHEVKTTYDGSAAIAAAQSYRPRVAFCDIGMPGVNGHEVAARLRADGAHATAALVAVTGWGTDEDRRKSREAGFDFHLTKPVDPRAIESVLERL